jgi:hypothetical protein
MKIVELSLEEFKRKFESMKRYIRPNFDLHPYMTEEERLQAIEKAMNPPLPLYIDWYEGDGMVRYVVKTKLRDYLK